MNENRIKSLVAILKTTIAELEDEVKSNPDSYMSWMDNTDDDNEDTLSISSHDYDYSELLTYYNTNDDDGDLD